MQRKACVKLVMVLVAGTFGPAADVASAAGPDGPSFCWAETTAEKARREKTSERRFGESTDIATPLAVRREMEKHKWKAFKPKTSNHHSMSVALKFKRAK
ncbi:MAG: hypothetical protein NTY05_07925 [Rhodocyclales bacterium]|nr:hypothetical protein [Rhodocyclales bacterium]